LPIKKTWSVRWLKGKKQSPVSNSFLKHLKSESARIVKEKFYWNEQY